MDPGDGMFRGAEDKKHALQICEDLKLTEEQARLTMTGMFQIGEEIKIKNSRFKVHAIKPKRLILKLLPRENK